MTARAALLAACALLALPSAAAAQGDAFSPLPPAQPRQTPQPVPTANPNVQEDEGGRETLYLIGAGLLVVFVVIGVVIVRDARASLPERERERDRLRDEGPHKHERRAKAKARKKGRAQRKARKTTRRKAR